MAVKFNGHPIDVGTSNSFPVVPSAFIQKGDNEVVLHGTPTTREHVKIALPADILRNAPERKDRPRRSFISPVIGLTQEADKKTTAWSAGASFCST